MSNVKLALLVLTALFLIIFFGHSPMDEMRKRRAERAGRKLVEKIEEANKKKNSLMPDSSFYTQQPGNSGMQNHYYNSQDPFQAANPYYRQNYRQDYRAPVPGANGQPFVPANSAPQQDNYYPPEPKNKQIIPPLSSLPDSRTTTLAKYDAIATTLARKALANPNLMTDAGKDLAFSGTKVYTYDEHGKLKPLADGNYPMYGGKWTMVVRGGEQVASDEDVGDW